MTKKTQIVVVGGGAGGLELVRKLGVEERLYRHRCVEAWSFVIPWIGIVLLGLVVGRDALTRTQPARRWLALAGVSLVVFLAIRLAAGYGNAYSYTRITSLDFWIFAKSACSSLT